jgi:signal transduction histidine kinase
MTPARIYELAMQIAEQSYRELAADTAHEIRTLLTPLEGYLVELGRHLGARAASDATSERYLATAFERLQQLRTLVDDLHVYSTPGERDFAPVDLAAVVRDAVALGSERAGAEGRIVGEEIDVPPGLIIDALPQRLVRAVANLVANAWQAMPDGGTLRVRARRRDDDRVELVIADRGHGMSAEVLAQARKRFRSTRRDAGGTGLGLPIAERIVVDDHGGELAIASTPGEGTTVTLLLPVTRP